VPSRCNPDRDRPSLSGKVLAAHSQFKFERSAAAAAERTQHGPGIGDGSSSSWREAADSGEWCTAVTGPGGSIMIKATARVRRRNVPVTVQLEAASGPVPSGGPGNGKDPSR
jgi:hypothetical protein